jgi:amino acid adenylation domain-containing protein
VSGDAERELLKDALLTIRALKADLKARDADLKARDAELQARAAARREPIAIVGIGCRFPGGANTPDAFWELLRDGVDAVREMPAGRWNAEAFYHPDPDAPGKTYVRHGAFLDDVRGFDAEFFGITPREAARLDPQQRLLLETSWEALEHAGLSPDTLGARPTGVFIGAMSTDYGHRQAHRLEPAAIDPYMLAGNDLSFAAGRLAYVLGLHGPAMVVSTACSSSLVSVHLAAQALRNGECDLALAGGVNVVLDPTVTVMLSKLRALARDGRCKTFDADADGYGRGEGCGMIVLERLSDAIARGHRVLAVVRGSAVNHDGASAGLTVPNGRAQEDLLRRALAAADVTADDVSYVEAHGTGTSLGDPIEVQALARVIGPRRGAPLRIGSVKTNIGHLEPAAGIAGLIKVVLSLRHRTLPPHLHFRRPNPHVAWDSTPIEVVASREEWTPANGRRVAGVSSFGLSGVNAHVILEEAPAAARRPAESTGRGASAVAIATAALADAGSGSGSAGAAPVAERLLHILTISGHTEAALAEQVARYQAYLVTQAEVFASAGREMTTAGGHEAGTASDVSAAWADVCFTATTGRRHFAHRVAIVASSIDDARRRLTAAMAARHAGDGLQKLTAAERQANDDAASEAVAAYIAADAAPGVRGAVQREDAPREDAPRASRRLLERIAELYARGAEIDWSAFNHAHASSRAIVTLPVYAFQRQDYWALDDDAAIGADAARQGLTSDRAADVRADEVGAGRSAAHGVKQTEAAGDDWRRQLAAVSEEQRIALMGNLVERAVKDVIGYGSHAPLSRERSLFDLGLDSLMSLELRDRVRAHSGVDLPISQLLADATIADLAARVLETIEVDASPDSPIDSVAATSASVSALVSETAASSMTPASLTLPLSYGQKALWFIHQSHPASPAYNVGVALRVRGEVDDEAMRRAFQILVDRHPSLRTVFSVEGDEPCQRVLAGQRVDFRVVNTSDLLDRADVTDDELSARVQEDYRQPFDLTTGPLLRVVLYRQSVASHVLLIAMHHIVCDAMSCWTLLEELRAIYANGASASATTTTTTSAPPIGTSTYAEFVAWQQAMVAGTEVDRQWQFWREQLSGELPMLDVPVNRPRPAMQTQNGASHVLTVPAASSDAIRALARAERATLHATLLAAFQVLLHRYTGQDDILVGTATAARPRQFAGCVGYFVNPVVIRASLAGDAAFDTVLGQVRERTIAALEHQHYPFPLLVERLQPKRDPSRSPIVQADFSLAQTPLAFRDRANEHQAGRGAALEFERFALAEEEGQFDLGLHVTDDGGPLVARFKYNADLFEPETMARMAESFQHLLEAIAANPKQQIGALRLLSDDERQRLIAAGTGPSVALTDVDTFVQDKFERQVELTPDAIAAECVSPSGAASASTAAEREHARITRITYRELNRRANQLAHDLRDCGVGPDTLVGVCLTPSIELVVSLLAVLKAGGAYLPLDPAYPVDRLAFMVRDAGIRILLTTRALKDRLPAEADDMAIYLDDEDEIEAHEAATRAATRAAGARADADENPVRVVASDHLAYVIYTSGSTGLPKGAMITHGGLGNYLSWALDAYRVAEGSCAPVNSSIAFDATVTSFFAPLLAGGRVILLPEDGVIETLAEVLRTTSDVSLVKITPAHLEVLAQQLAPELSKAKADGSFGVNAFVIGGEAVRTDMLASWQQAAPRTRLINEYGPTETVVGCCVYDAPVPSAAEPAQAGPVPIGKPIANTQLYILDARRELVPAGVIGELFIGGAGVARGYLNRPELTEARFVHDPFTAAADVADATVGEGVHTPRLYRTGDLVRWRADGEMEFVGRTDAQVKIRGFRIEPGEIEAVLAEHPAVAESFVMARDLGAAGRQLVAYIVRHETHGEVEFTELKRHLAARLPEYMVPAAIVTLDAFPLTPNGKIDRRALPAPEMTGTRRDLAAPRDPLEMTLAAIWQEVLGVSPVGIRDNFFDLGGHSLLAVRLLARVERAFGQAVPLATILRGPTIEQMATLLRQTNASATSALVPFQSVAAGDAGSARPAFFCVPGAGGNPIYLSNLARALGSAQPFYGLEGAGFNGDRAPHTTVEEMAAYYIDAIRAVQPEGPYHLGGHSLGGWVAFEMARQLRRQGHEVPLVAIIDTPVPAPADTSARAAWDEAKWIAELTDRIAKLLAPELRLDEETLRASTHEQRMDAFRDALIAAGVYPAEGGLTYLRHTLDVFKAHACVSYAPTPLPGSEAGAERILLLRTPNEPSHVGAAWAPGDPTWGWSRLAQTEVVIVPGDHLAVLRPPHVALLAERLSESLAQALPVAA